MDLSVRKGSSILFTDQVQGRHRLRAVSAIGETFPLHCTAPGKAILSLMPTEQQHRLVKGRLPRLTAHTITKTSELLKQIEACRRSGLAIDNEEHTEGISALGTAFFDPLGRAVALSVPVPTARFHRVRPLLQTRLLEARQQILAALGQRDGLSPEE